MKIIYICISLWQILEYCETLQVYLVLYGLPVFNKYISEVFFALND